MKVLKRKRPHCLKQLKTENLAELMEKTIFETDVTLITTSSRKILRCSIRVVAQQTFCGRACTSIKTLFSEITT